MAKEFNCEIRENHQFEIFDFEEYQLIVQLLNKLNPEYFPLDLVTSQSTNSKTNTVINFF